MTIGSLFSGIGGLELGLEWAGLGPTIWQVEQDQFCRSVLAKHWPEADRFDDVRAVGADDLRRVDLICGGFPCQDVSGAGKGKGLAGSRSGLWSEFARIIGALSPRWVVVENVAHGASNWFDAVIRDLGKLDYDCLPVPLSASTVGAPHLRNRIFVLAAYAYSIRQHESQGRESVQRRWTTNRDGQDHGNHWIAQPSVAPLVDGLPGRVARYRRRMSERALGNAVVPQCAEVIGWMIRELECRRD